MSSAIQKQPDRTTARRRTMRLLLLCEMAQMAHASCLAVTAVSTDAAWRSDLAPRCLQHMMGCPNPRTRRLLFETVTIPVKLQLRNRFIHVGVDTSRYALLIGGRSLYPPCVS